MVLSDGGLGEEDASMADFEEGLSTKTIKRWAFENLDIFSFVLSL
jgi:hypothetical protein